MQGDFSKFNFDPHEHDRAVAQAVDAALRNRVAVLQQQGRVVTDADASEAELIDLAWQAQAGRDLIGAGVCAVPASEADGFRVDAAAVVAGEVRVAVRPGRAWVDGLLARLPGAAGNAAGADGPGNPDAPEARRADYYGAPFTAPQPSGTTIGEGVRDVVVLEAWHDVLHGFQYPQALIEPALGGPDTTERAFLAFRFRLLRLAGGEDCNAVRTRLADDPSQKGRLSVSLAPVIAIGGDCPVVGGGGYSGLEHNLYRIEIADANAGTPLRFKWSPVNGGLAGRGHFDASGGTPRVVIDAGRSAIVNAGTSEFYLEALQFDAQDGRWRVSYASFANLDASQDLALVMPASFGTLPATLAPVFFRLWSGLRDVSEFSGQPQAVELRDGIRLDFNAGAPGWLQPGDYWTFAVRAGEIANAAVLIDAQPPVGIAYHRVALAEILWHGGGAVPLSAEIEDCRQRFRPLTQQRTCCTFLVGDGFTSFGDFNSLEEAASRLPAIGGELCLLPGVHRANLRLQGRRAIRIHGCAHRSFVFPRTESRAQPVLEFVDCTDIEVCGLDLLTYDASAVSIEGSEEGACRDVRVHDNRMVARRNAIRAVNGVEILIEDNRLHLLDTLDGRAMISLAADDVRVERNTLLVLPFIDPTPQEPEVPDGDPTHDPADPCATSSVQYQFPKLLLAYAHAAWETEPTSVASTLPYRGLGGIHVRPGSERVRIAHNTIVGGAGHGITLGGDLEAAEASPAPAQPVRVNVATGALFVALVADPRGEPMAGVDVYLEAQSVTTDRSDAEGMVSIKATPGVHTLSVAAGLRIARVAEARDEGVLVTAVTLVAQPAPPTLRGFVHELTIEGNDISMMGLSGIGFGLRFGVSLAPPPVALPADPRSRFLGFIDLLIQVLALTPLLRATDPVRDLVIRDNRIHHNLQMPFGPVLLAAAQVVGFGGITLPVCDAVVISGNHIYENGLEAINPVCGVFLGCVNDAEVTDNVLAANGSMTEDYEQKAQSGLRGGIFVRFAGALTSQFSTSTGRKPAIRIHDNRIDHSAGRTLTVYAFGPVSIANNSLNSEFSGRFGFIDAAVGGVLVINLGGLHRVLARTVANYFDKTGALASLAERALPGGETVFADNLLRVGSPNRSMLANLLLVFDDIGFSANTSSVFRVDPLLGNVLLLADTLRATGSRLREDAFCTASITSRALRANITSLNQADHAVLAFPSTDPQALVTVSIPNHVLKPNDCKLLAPAQQTFSAFFDNAVAAHAGTLGGVVTAAEFGDSEVESLALGYSAAAVDTVNATQVARTQANQVEAVRMARKHGANHPAARALRDQVDAGALASRLLATQAEAVQVQVPKSSGGGAVLSGRLVNARGQGLRDHVIGLLRSNGTPLETVGTTDTIGYFTASYPDERAAVLEKEGDLFIRVNDFAGKEVLRTDTPIQLAPGANVQRTLTVPLRIVPRSVIVDGTVIFGGDRPTPTTPPSPPSPSPPQPPPPSPPSPPSPAGTPLQRLDIDEATIKLLVENEIPDVEAIVETQPAKLATILGDRDLSTALMKRAKALLALPPVKSARRKNMPKKRH